MKMNPNKMLYEKASAMARKMDETYDKTEACAKGAENACKRAAIMHAAAIAMNVILSAAASMVVCWFMLE